MITEEQRHGAASLSEVIPAAGEAAESREPLAPSAGVRRRTVAAQLLRSDLSSRLPGRGRKAEDPGPERHGGCGVVPECHLEVLGSPVPARAALGRGDEPRGRCTRASTVREDERRGLRPGGRAGRGQRFISGAAHPPFVGCRRHLPLKGGDGCVGHGRCTLAAALATNGPRHALRLAGVTSEGGVTAVG